MQRRDQHGALEFRDVGFHYPGAEHPVLSDISFTTRAGQTTAIVGSTGAGKTTLVNLILRLFDSTEGDVLVGGVDVRDLDSRRAVEHDRARPAAAVPLLGHRREQPAVRQARRHRGGDVGRARGRAGADFVQAMPGGLDARIEQGGTNVSGGQRQRLSIARALIRRPDIYVFDDSFSALDLATDARLRAALGPYTKDAAVVDRGAAVSTIVDRRQHPRARRRRGHRAGHARRADRDCPTYAEIVQSQIGEKSAA